MRTILTVDERFWSKVDRSGGPDACWPWMASTGSMGYGQFGLGGTMRPAHTVAFELTTGFRSTRWQPLDHVCHSTSDCALAVECPHRRCVNPAHLEVVTPGENARRGERTRRSHCPHGHEYTEENTYIWRGSRYCRECNRLKCRRRYSLTRTLPAGG